jgi:cyclophilin family peptidyl-prolyl cis-trans isomerase
MQKLMYVAGVFLASLGATAAVVAYMRHTHAREREAVQALPLYEGNPVVFFDVEDDEVPVGRIVVQLRRDVCPRAAENFRVLADMRLGYGYRGCAFHAVEKQRRLFTGDFFGSGTSGFSIYGDTFADEDVQTLKHLGPGTVAMLNYGKDTNNSQFYISTRSLSRFDGIYQVVGYVMEGFEVLDAMDRVAVGPGFQPGHKFRIARSGELDVATLAPKWVPVPAPVRTAPPPSRSPGNASSSPAESAAPPASTGSS